jgi:hypothetical protein
MGHFFRAEDQDLAVPGGARCDVVESREERFSTGSVNALELRSQVGKIRFHRPDDLFEGFRHPAQFAWGVRGDVYAGDVSYVRGRENGPDGFKCQ